MDAAGWLTLLHILILVYWLGADLGAFLSASVLADAARPASARMAAAGILLNVDMAPRMALIFALPTGLALANAKGWLAVEPLWVVIAFLGALVWAAIALRIHLAHGRAPIVTQADRIWRVTFALALLAVAVAGAFGVIELALFISLKLAILGAAVGLGLAIRVVLKPFEAAIGSLARGHADDVTNAVISQSISRVRVLVVMLWALLLGAAFLGIALPA
ncbi:MAG: hypothetical protein HLUCCA04_13310 [Oceanicaulis sp. HLUCCA04]|nr:MAG: hypothetical protein HLUCCA04_13310 [Oceanicaulis sp. HLUCCA04]